MTELPEGWGLPTLADVCEVSPRDTALNADAPFVPMDAVHVGQRYPTYHQQRGGRGGVRAKAGDVLFARITPCLENGKVAQVPAEWPLTGGSTEFLVVRPGIRVNPGFLYYWCLEPRVRADARSMMAGATGRMRLSASNLRTFKIPVPPLAEQRCIVDILEDRLSHLDAALKTVDRVSAQVDAWQRSCIDRVLWSDERTVTFTPVRELLAEKMRNGFSGRASTSPNAVRSLTLTAVTENAFTEANTKLIDADDRRVRNLWLKNGDIFVQRSNTPQLVGTSAYYCGADDWAIFPDLLIRLRANTERVIPRYLAASLRSERAHRQLRRRAKGLAGSMPKIDQTTIGDLHVPVPTRDVQEARVRETSVIAEASERLRSAGDEADHRSAALRRSLLTAAFTGRLTGRSTDAEIIEELADAPA